MRVLRRALILASLLFSLVAQATAQGEAHVDLLTIEGAITPVVASYMERGIEMAEADGAEALIIELNTPGGSVSVMEGVVQRMAISRVPIVVYVYPQRAQAASAGTFVVLAAHVAAMAPGTSIGAASPVSGQGEELPETEQAKAINIMVSLIKGLSERRGEAAAEWAEKAVREAVAATDQEALDLGVVDFVVPSLDTLLQELDGFEVELQGQTVTLETTGARVERIPMNPIESFLHTITDPNIAFILMTLGINGLIFELSGPGVSLAGIVGAICILLSLYALGVLSVNYTGFLFIALAFVLFVADIKAPTHGLLTVGGIISFIFGSIILFQSPFARVSTSLVVGVGLGSGGFFAFAVAKAVQARMRRAVTGREALVGTVAVARTDLDPTGSVFLRGEWWNAIAEGEEVRKGEQVEVIGVDGFQLRVKKKE